MRTFLQDIRYAARAFARSPGFTAVAVLSLTLGLGANTTIFSIANAFLAQEIRGAEHAGELVRIYQNRHSPWTPAELRFLRERARSFTDIVGERMMPVVRSDGEGEPERITAAMTTGDFFGTLGVRAAAGRLFGPADSATRDPVVVLSHRYWRDRFAADPASVGRSLRINDRPYTVVGVAAAGFESSQFIWTADVYFPLAIAADVIGQDPEQWGGSMYTTARLRPGVSMRQAQAELDVLMRQLAATDTGRYARTSIRIGEARGITQELRGAATVASSFLLAVVGVVLLIACANVANLMLARATMRRREIGVRMALGASRRRLAQQMLTEGLLLALVSAVPALLLAAWASDALAAYLVSRVPEAMALDVAPDRRVVAFAALLALATTFLFGLAPALQATRRDVVAALKDDATTSGFRRSRLRGSLVVVQVALCTVLLAGATLFLRSLVNARTIDPGFDPTGVVDVPVALAPRQLDSLAERDLQRRLLERARSVPGVRSATYAVLVPLGGSNMETGAWLEGTSGEEARRATYFNVVGTDYFETLGIPLVRGRAPRETDRGGAPLVVVVNETLASRFWPGADAIGRRVSLDGPEGPWREVVGVARDTKYNALGEETPAFAYLPLLQEPRSDVILHARSDGSSGVLRALAALPRELDPRLPPPRAAPIEDDMRIALLPAQIGAALLGAFGSLALLLAAVGVYGVAAFAVAQRTHEIGIRTALGAERGRVMRMVLGDSLRRVAVGLAIGLLGALGVGRLLASQLYGVGATDLATFVATPLVLGLVALAASWVPARRAARVDPLLALRAAS